MTLFLLCPTSTRLSHLLSLPEFLVSTPRLVDSGHRNPVAVFCWHRKVACLSHFHFSSLGLRVVVAGYSAYPLNDDSRVPNKSVLF